MAGRSVESSGPQARNRPAIQVRIERSVMTTPPVVSERVLEVASMFGLGIDESRTRCIVPESIIHLRAGEIVFITGPSGSGKSTILRLIAEVCATQKSRPAPTVIDFNAFLDVTSCNDNRAARPIVDHLGNDVQSAMRVLSIAGLADAFLALRTPTELSDGQRYRFAIARMIDDVERRLLDSGARDQLIIVLADEFGSALDHTTAELVARNIRRWVSRTRNVCLVAATAHDELMESLEPDVLVYKPLDASIEIVEARAC